MPDVSLSASGYDGYLVFAGGEEFVFGGTSASTPSFAGIIALLNQYENSNGQGNINPNLYRLAQSDIFHDITFGDNMVPCSSGTPDCLTGSLGYSAGIGYDLATGLGSVDAYKLVTKWKIATPQSKVTISSNPAQVAQQAPDANR